MADSTAQMPITTSRKINYLPVNQTYDLWASVYDSDGNILQSLDSLGLERTLLPRLFSLLADSPPPQSEPPAPFHVTDLGTGTGRATLAFLSALQSPPNTSLLPQLFPSNNQSMQITGLDSSENMLSIARERVPPTTTIPIEPSGTLAISTTFRPYNINTPPSNPPPLADALICALVLEHLPTPSTLFKHIVTYSLLKPGGLLLLTNMHPDMARGADPTTATKIGSSIENEPTTGRLATQAGFVDPKTGEKVRPEEDWAHTMNEVMEAAGEEGFQLVDSDKMEEAGVERWMIQGGLVDGKRGEKWARGGVTCWFGGVFKYTGKGGVDA